MTQTKVLSWSQLPHDLVSGLVVFLVALPLCLGVALASEAPLMAGLIAGILGGIVVGMLSGSHTSVSGPAAGLTAIVAAQIKQLESFESFLLAVTLAGVLQFLLGVFRAGAIAVFVPASVIKGLLAAIGVILVLKQVPHVLGDDNDPEGEMAFVQPDGQTTLSELGEILSQYHLGAALIGLMSIVFLVFWDNIKRLKQSIIPAPLLVVVFGILGAIGLNELGGDWAIGTGHLVRVPVAESVRSFASFMKYPNFSAAASPAIYYSAFVIALVASLETLLNLEAVDKLDPRRRVSPPNRELMAQGAGNILSGLIGGLPMTSVIVRSSVNINAGGKSKLATIVHGILLLVCVLFLPTLLNRIPLSCLAAILLVTGMKLASPKLFKQMWSEGPSQFIPFLVTVTAIVLTDLLVGVLIGLAVAVGFILHSNMRRPLRRIVERHLSGEVLRIELANQVSFLNRAQLTKAFQSVKRGDHVLIDASTTVYIDPDVLSLIREFRDEIGPARGVKVSLRGFRDKYQLQDQIQFADYSTRELQTQMTPDQVLQILTEGNERFRRNQKLTRDFDRQMSASADGQHPLAVILSCIDSRTPAELIFDLGLGDIFSIRVAGNVPSRKILASMEYGCAVVGAKLLLVVGHTRCGAVTAAISTALSPDPIEEATGCQHLDHILKEIQGAVDESGAARFANMSPSEQQDYVNEIARRNVLKTVQAIKDRSHTLRRLVDEGKIKILGAMYDVKSGEVRVLQEEAREVAA